MDELLYKEQLLEVFQNPKNKGELAKPDLEAKLLNPICGDEIEIQLKLSKNQPPITKNQTIAKAVFSGNGCAISQASASLLAENIEGKRLDEVKLLKSDDILKLIGISPSPARMKCAVLGLEVLKKAMGGK